MLESVGWSESAVVTKNRANSAGVAENQPESAGIAMEAFARLRSEQQQILELAIHHGHSHEQISATTGLPLGTVKSHARRGLLRLREMLSSNETRSERRGVIGGMS